MVNNEVRIEDRIDEEGDMAPWVVSRIEEMLGDQSVSEAARAKLYYYATGRRVMPSTIMRGELREDGEGGFIVESRGAYGVITSRTFNNRKSAELELERIGRQAELNQVQFGERYQQGRAFEERLQEACQDVARQQGLDALSVYRTCEEAINRKGKVEGEIDEAQQHTLRLVVEAMGEFGETEVTDALRAKVSEKHGVDVDMALRKDGRPQAGDEPAAPEEPGEGEPRAAGAQYKAQYDEGYNDVAEIVRKYGAEHGAEETAAWLEGQIEKCKAWRDNGNDNPTVHGQLAALEDGLAQLRGGGAEQADAQPIGRAVMKVDDRPVEVLSGRVEVFEDGTIDRGRSEETIVIRDLATGKVEMVSPEAMLSYEGMPAEAPAPIDKPAEMPTEMPAEMPQGRKYGEGRMIIKGEDGVERLAWTTGYVNEDGKLEYYVDGSKHLDYATEEELDKMVVDYKPAPPRPEEAPVAAPADKPATEEEMPATPIDKPAAETPSPAADAAAPAADAVAPAAVEPAPSPAPAEAPAPAEPTALERLPRNEKGEPAFERADTPEHGWDALVEFAEGDKAFAQEIADSMAEEKRKALDKAQKQKPKGKTPTEMLASKKANAQAVAQAQAEYDAWRGIAAVEQSRESARLAAEEAESRRLAAERAEREKAEREAAEERQELERRDREAIAGKDKSLRKAYDKCKDNEQALDILRMQEPTDILEAAALVLSTNKLLWGSSGVKRGLSGETGFTEGDRRKFFTMFASEEKGGQTLARLAEDKMQQTCNTHGIPYDNQEALNALIEVMLSAETPSDIRYYIRDRRIEQALEVVENEKRELRIYEEEARQRYLEDHGFTSEEEYQAYQEYAQEYAEAALKDFDETEYMSFIVDELDAVEGLTNNTLKTGENEQKTDIVGRGGSNVAQRESGTHGAERSLGNQKQVDTPVALGTRKEGSTTDERTRNPLSEGRGNLSSDGTGSEGGAEPAKRGGRAEGDDQAQAVGQKRTDYIDPRTMPDNEKARRGDMLRNAQAVDVATRQIVATKELPARKAAEKWWEDNVGEPKVYDTEVGEVEINKKSVESSLAHNYGQRKLDAITSLADGFKNAIYLGTLPDSRERGVVDHYFAYPINYDGERCYVFCRAMQDANKNRLYVHEVFASDRIKKGDTLQTAASKPHGGISLYRDILANVLETPKPIDKTTDTGDNPTDLRGDTALSQNSDVSDRKVTQSAPEKQGNGEKSDKAPGDKPAGKDPLHDEVKEWLSSKGLKAEESSRNAVMRNFGIGYMRAGRMLEAIAREGEQTPGDKPAPAPEDKRLAEESPKPKKRRWISDEDAQEFDKLRNGLRDHLGQPGDMVSEPAAEYGGQQPQTKPMDAEVLRLGTRMTYLMMKGGLRKFADYVEAMVEEVGDGIRPHLKSLYAAAQNMEEVMRLGWDEEMDDRKTVKAFDVYNFDKPGAKDIVATAQHVVDETASQEQADKIIQTLKDERNEQRRKEDDKTAAGTEAVASQAEAAASQAESELEAARTERAVERQVSKLDKELEEVNKQLALLGYYEADEVDKDFNEAYGYMRNAERKATQDAHRLATQLAADLGIEIDPKDKVRKARHTFGSKIAQSDAAPAGGEVIITLPLANGLELKIWVGLDKNEKECEGYREDRISDDLMVTSIMYRVEDPNGKERYVTSNHNIKADATYDELLAAVRRLVRGYLPDEQVKPAEPLAPKSGEDYVGMAKRVADDAAKKRGVEPEQTLGDLFGGKHQVYDRTTPTTPEEQRSAISKIIGIAKRLKDRVERAVIGGITQRQKQDLSKVGVEIDESWVHSFETSAVIHNQKHHGNEAAEAKRNQTAITPEDYNRIPDILENYDKVSKSANKAKGTNNEVIVYEKEFEDGYVYYLEEKRDSRKSLAFHTMYKKKKGADSSDGFAVDTTAPITPLAPSDNLDSFSAGKGTKKIINDQKNEKTELQPGAEKGGRGGQQPRPDEPLGAGARHEDERADGGGVARRGGEHTVPDAERGSGISGQHKGERSVTGANQRQTGGTNNEPRNSRNNHAERGVDYAPKGEKARIEANLAAIELAERGGRAQGDDRAQAVGQKRTAYIDPRTMPDNEKARRGDMLRNAQAVDVATRQIVATKELPARKAAEKWWEDNVGEPKVYDTEVGEVEINKNSVESSLAHNYGQRKLDAITSLADGFKNAIYLGTMPDFTRQEGVSNHFFAYPINYNGSRCYVICRAMQDANKNRLYVHEVFTSDKIKKGDTLQTAAFQPHGGISLYRDILANVLETPKPIDKTTDTGDNPTDLRGDTALSQNSDVSDRKVTNSAPEKQGNGEKSDKTPGDKPAWKDALHDEVKEWLSSKGLKAEESSRNAVMREFKIGYRRAGELLEAIAKGGEGAIAGKETGDKKGLLSDARVQSLRDKVLAEKGNGITVFEETVSADGKMRGLRIGNKITAGLYWEDSITGELGKEDLADSRKRLAEYERNHSRNERLAKVKSASDFWEYLKSIGEADPKRGVQGYDIIIWVKQAKAALENERYYRDVHIPLLEIMTGESARGRMHAANGRKGNQEAYRLAKEVVETSGIEVLEVSDEDARAVLDNKESADAVPLKDTECKVYGWVADGKVYLNRDAMNPETPVHEYTHLWDEMVRKENPALWRRGVELMKETPLWEEVVNDPKYADIRDDEDAVASEVHARLTGEKGAKAMEEMIESAKKDGPLATAKAVTLVERLKQWLSGMFKTLKDTLGKWSQRDLAELTADDFARMTMRDLAEGLDPRNGDKNLVAVHNITEEKLKEALDLGGLAMPSIAIAKAGEGHSEFGEISLVFGKESVNPADRLNKVYGGDAWTPTFPRVGYKLNSGKAAAIYKRANAAGSLPLFRAAAFHPDNYERRLDGKGDASLAASFMDDYGAKQLHLSEKGNPVTSLEEREVEKYSPEAIGLYEKMLDAIGENRLRKESYEMLEPEVGRLIRAHGVKDIDNKPPFIAKAIIKGAIIKALDYADTGNLKVEADVEATRAKIDSRIDPQEYRAWLEELFAGIVESKGIRNGRDRFTPSGESRQWEQLYDTLTLENVVRAMRKESEKGGEGMLGSSIFGASAKELKDIEEIRQEAAERISSIAPEELEAGKSRIMARLEKVSLPSVSQSMSDSLDFVENVIGAVKKAHTPSGIYRHLSGIYKDMTMAVANEIADIVKDIQKMSTRYLEAKPQRAVSFEEVKLAVVPEDAPNEIIERLRSHNIPVRVYDRGNEHQRASIISQKTSEMELRFHAAMSRRREEFETTRKKAVAEKGIAMPGLKDADVAVVSVSRHGFEGERPISQAREWTKENIVGEHELTDSRGEKIRYAITNKAVEKYLSRSAVGKSDNLAVHLSVLKSLPGVIGESIEAEVHPDYHKDANGNRSAENGYAANRLIHRFYGAAEMDGKTYRVKTTIVEDAGAQNNKPHSFEVTAVELIEETAGQDGREGSDTHRPRYSESSSEKSASGNEKTIPAAKLLNNVKKSYDPKVNLLEASEYSEKSANFAVRYETKEGKTINYASENAEAYGGLFLYDNRRDRNDRPGANAVRGEDNPLRSTLGDRLSAERGEFCHVERVFEEKGGFNFMAGERIESAADVAYIFSSLEDAAKEHSFVVLVKDGKPTVVELGMGTFSAVAVDRPTALLAYMRIKPDEVYFVHNHPSGRLMCSPEDVNSLRSLSRAMPEVPVHGVIINLKTGKYGTFDTSGRDGKGQKRVPSESAPLSVYSLDKQIFSPDYDPEAQPLVQNSKDVAPFVNSHRMGDRAKVSFLILNRGGRVVGNIHTPFKDIETGIDAKARYIVERVLQFGGESAIIYGDFQINYLEGTAFSVLKERAKTLADITLHDVVRVEGNNSKSLLDLGFAREPQSEYGSKEGGLRFREVDDEAVLKEFAEGKTVKAYRTMQVIDGKLYSPMATKVGGKETPEIKLGVPEQAEEHPEIINGTATSRQGREHGYVTIDKGLGKGTLKVAYNPYVHTSRTALNDQFSSAYIRPNLVTVEVEVPQSELTSGYRAERAKDAVGEISWHSGSVSGQLAELGQPRKVILTRYDRPVRIVPYREVAEMIARQLDGTDVSIPYNVVQPQVRAELERLGVAISEAATGKVGAEADYGRAEYITDQEIERINARQQEMAQTSIEAKSRHAEKMAQRLNTPVRIVADVEELGAPGDKQLAERMRKSKGWYDTQTGEVVVVLPNHASVEDVAETVFHEVVAHKGLREMVGEENYDAFCDEVYGHLKDDLKQGVDQDATRRFMKDPGRGYEEHRREAVDEMFGRLAEKGFEDFTKAERGIWAKLKAKVLEAINKFLGSLKLPKWVKLGDNELRYMLWRSHERLSGKGDYVDMARDAAKREELGLNGNDAVPVNKPGAEDVERTNKAFNEQLQQQIDGTLPEGHIYQIGMPGAILRAAGFPNAAIELSSKHLAKKSAQRHHEFGIGDLMDLPKEIQNPIAVFRYGDRSKSENVIVGISKEGKQFVVGVHFNQERRGTEVSDIRGLFPKENAEWLNWISQGKAEWLDKEKIQALIDQQRTNLAEVEYLDLDDVAKLVNNFENPIASEEKSYDFRFRDGETDDIWRDGSLGLEEKTAATLIRLSNNQSGDLALRNNAQRAVVNSLQSLLRSMRSSGVKAGVRGAMNAQAVYDRATVKRVKDLARVLMQTGYISDATSDEMQRLLSAVSNATGTRDIAESVEKIMDVMIGNQLRNAKATLDKLLAIRGSKVDARGIEVQGALDVDGQRTMEVVKKAMRLTEDEITDRVDEAINRMGDTDQTIADNAALEYAGLQFALEYVQNIGNSKADETALRDMLKTAKEEKDAGRMTADAYKQQVEAINEAIRKNKIERVEAYSDLVERLSGTVRDSIDKAKAFREAEKVRIKDIQHNANSDMEGRPSNEHHKDGRIDKIMNNGVVQFVFAPLATFDQVLRVFGNKSVNGEGYLWNRFMRGWVDCREKELVGFKKKLARLNAKAEELFGKGKTWGDLIRMESKLPKATVSFMDGGEMREHELTQGNLLYIYMVDKMTDGRMKLRAMGITEADVARIESVLDPRFKALGDWLQDEFLVETRNEYNETHKRIFGASMAAIENYFPLKILGNARVDKEDDVNQQGQPNGITTKTGSIIKRRVNKLALDITGADALSVILNHLTDMEHWNAYAEWNRDLNTLRTYKRFRNQVMNMTTVYGGRRELWKKINDLCLMAAGEYRPPVAKLDKAAVNIAKGVTAAKVSFRIYTALKQFLSAPAYAPEVSLVSIAKSIANPYGDFKWCLENLPIFEERWHSRIAGDPRLLRSELDWKGWRNRVVEIAGRVGMTPNAFVDAVTVSIGAKAIYETRLKQYLKEGYAAAAAEKRAKQDATILFNQTQQSSEAPFLSTMQVDSSWLSVMFTVFRNSPMSYTRQEFDAMRNLTRNLLKPGQKGKSIAFMTKQILRDWEIDPNTATDAERSKAENAAKSRFSRQIRKDLLRVATFGFVLQLFWNLGPYLPYLIFGKDEDEKDKMWDDAITHAYFGSVEGLTGGDVMSAFGNMAVSGEWNWNQLSKDMPIASDIGSITNKYVKGKDAEALNDIVNLVVQMGAGVNPQSLTDPVLAIVDASGGDMELGREATLFAMRVMQVPQSQIDKIYFDEIDLSAEEASKLDVEELVKRYAKYKVMRGTTVTPWNWDDEELLGKYEKTATTRVKERLMKGEDQEVVAAYNEFEDRYKAVSKKERAYRKALTEDYVNAAAAWTEYSEDPDAWLVMDPTFEHCRSTLSEMSEALLGSKTAAEAQEHNETLRAYRAAVVKYLQASEDDEHSYQILRSISNAFSHLKVELGEYLHEDGSTSNNRINKTVEEGGQLQLSFLLPSNFNNSACDSLGGMLHEYIVDRTLSEWFVITDKQDAQDYAALAKDALDRAKQALYKRERPQRPTYESEPDKQE